MTTLLHHLIDKINTLIHSESHSDNCDNEQAVVIGVLDINVFESLTTKSFDQLCINYCHEALQQQYLRVVIKNE